MVRCFSTLFVFVSSNYRVGQSLVVSKVKFSRKWSHLARRYHNRNHFQCWSLCHQSWKYGHLPSTRHHLLSCGQLSNFTSGIKQCIFRRYLSCPSVVRDMGIFYHLLKWCIWCPWWSWIIYLDLCALNDTSNQEHQLYLYSFI